MTPELQKPTETWRALLVENGLQSTLLYSDFALLETTDSGEAQFQCGILIIRFVRDRGQDFVEIARSTNGRDFERLTDISVALGWRTSEEIVDRKTPCPIQGEVARIAGQREEVEEAYSSSRVRAEWAERSIQNPSKGFWWNTAPSRFWQESRRPRCSPGRLVWKGRSSAPTRRIVERISRMVMTWFQSPKG